MSYARRAITTALKERGYKPARLHWSRPRLVLEETCDPDDWRDYLDTHGDADVTAMFLGGWEVGAVPLDTPLDPEYGDCDSRLQWDVSAPYTELVIDAIGGLP